MRAMVVSSCAFAPGGRPGGILTDRFGQRGKLAPVMILDAQAACALARRTLSLGNAWPR